MKNIVKILTALATVAGAVYIIATYGEQIVAWAKQLWAKMPKATVEVEIEPDEAAEAEVSEEVEAVEEEAAAEEVPAPEAAEEVPEIVVTENEPVAAEEDFAE